MNLIYGAIVGIAIYNIIGTVVVALTNEDDYVYFLFTTGFIGVIINLVYHVRKLYKKIYTRKFLRSIIEDKLTHIQYYCQCEYYDDFINGTNDYIPIKRYATKDMWKDLCPVSIGMLHYAQKYCKYCLHDGTDCTEYNVLCKHDCWGNVEEYDKFQRKW